MGDVVEIERKRHEEADVTLRIVEKTGKYAFHAVEILSEGRGGKEDWHRIGSTSNSLEEARADERSYVAHLIERKSLPRRDVGAGIRTPWGVSDSAVEYGPGVVVHSTPSHGGFKLDRANNAKVHAALRSAGGWYEEDSEWAVVAHTFPALFTERERAGARRTLVNWRPHDFMAATGETIRIEESRALREEAFKEASKDSLVVISALRRDDGRVDVTATLGGERKPGTERRNFVLEPGVYDQGEFGFVIDLALHEEIEPESSGPRM